MCNGTALTTGSCLDLGPASSNANMAARISEMSVQEYFVNYQLPVAVVVVASVCIMHYFVQRHMDRKAGTTPDNADWEEIREELAGQDEPQVETKKVPALYALLPFTPLVLLIVFSPFVVTSIKMNVATAMIISGLIAVVCEMIRFRSFDRGAQALSTFFDGMGRQFVNIVTLIVGGQMFAAGLTQLGFIDFIVGGAQKLNMGALPIMVIMSLIIFLAAVLTGSGNAPWFAFSELTRGIAGPSA